MKVFNLILIYFIFFLGSVAFSNSTSEISLIPERLFKMFSPPKREDIERVKEGIKNVKDQNELLYWKGILYFYQGEFKKAGLIFERLLFTPKIERKLYASTLLAKAKLELLLERDTDFIIHINQFLKEYPEHPEYIDALCIKARFYIKNLVSFDDILNFYHRLIKKYPENADEIKYLTGFKKGYQLFGVYEAMTSLENIPKNSKYYDWARLYQGILFAYELNKFDEAIPFFESIPNGSKEYYKAQILLSYIKVFHLTSYFSAIDNLNNISKDVEYFNDSLLLKGIIYQFLLPDYIKAEEVYFTLFKRSKKGSYFYYQSCYRLAQIKEKQGQDKKAMEFYNILGQSKISFYKQIASLANKRLTKLKSALMLREAVKYYREQDFKRSVSIYKKIIKLYPDSIEAEQSYLRIGMILVNSFMDYYGAIDVLKQYLDNGYTRYKDLVYFRLAEIYKDYIMNYDVALKYYYEIINKYKNSLWFDDAIINIAHILKEVYEDYNQAVIVYKKGLDVIPEGLLKARIRYNLAKLYEEKLKDFKNAEKFYKEIIDNNLTSDFFKDAYKGYWELNTREYIEKGKKHLKHNERDLKVIIKLAKRYEKLNDFNEALSYYKNAYDISDSKEIFNTITSLYEKTGDYKELIKFLRHCINKIKEDNDKKKELRWDIFFTYRLKLKDDKNSRVVLNEIERNHGKDSRIRFHRLLLDLNENKKILKWPGIDNFLPETMEVELFSKDIITIKELDNLKNSLKRIPNLLKIINDEEDIREKIKELKDKVYDNNNNYKKLAEIYVKRDEFEKAAEMYENYADTVSNKYRPDFLFKAALYYEKSNNIDKFEELLEKLIMNYPDNENFNTAITKLFDLYNNKGLDFSDIVSKLLDRFLDKEKDLLIVFLKLYKKSELYSNMIEPTINRLLGMDVENKWELLLDLFNFYKTNKRYKDAIEVADRILELKGVPDFQRFSLYYHKGKILDLFFNDFNAAKKAYLNALSINVKDKKGELDWINNRLNAINEGEKLNDYLRFIDENLGHSKVVEYYFKIASIFDDFYRDYEQAEKYYNLIISGFSDSNFFDMAKGRLKLLKVKKLIKEYQQFLNENPDYEYANEILYRIARLYLDDLGDFDRGIEGLKAILSNYKPDKRLYSRIKLAILEAYYKFNYDDKFIEYYNNLKVDNRFTLKNRMNLLKAKFDARIKTNKLMKHGKYLEAIKLFYEPIHSFKDAFDIAKKLMGTTSEIELLRFILENVNKTPKAYWIGFYNDFVNTVSGKRRAYFSLINFLILWPDNKEDIIFDLYQNIRFLNTNETKLILNKLKPFIENNGFLRDYTYLIKLLVKLKKDHKKEATILLARVFYLINDRLRAVSIIKKALIDGILTNDDVETFYLVWKTELKLDSLMKKYIVFGRISPFFYLKASELFEGINNEVSIKYLEDFLNNYKNPLAADVIIPVLFKLASLYEKEEKYSDAIKVLRKIVVRFNDLKSAIKAQLKIAYIASKNLKNEELLEDAKLRFKRYFPLAYNTIRWEDYKIEERKKKERKIKKQKLIKKTKKKKRIVGDRLKEYMDEINKLRKREKEFSNTLEGAKIKEQIADIFIEMERYEDAYNELLSIKENYNKKAQPDDLNIRLFEISRDYLKRYDKAAYYLRKYLDTTTDEEDSINTLVLLADLYENYSEEYNKAIEVLKELSDRYGLSEEGKEGIYKQAIIYEERLNDYEKSIELYNEFIENNIDNELAAEAALRVAKIYEEYYNDYEKAKEKYEFIIDTFPQQEYRDIAQEALDRMRDEGKIE